MMNLVEVLKNEELTNLSNNLNEANDKHNVLFKAFAKLPKNTKKDVKEKLQEELELSAKGLEILKKDFNYSFKTNVFAFLDSINKSDYDLLSITLKQDILKVRMEAYKILEAQKDEYKHLKKLYQSEVKRTGELLKSTTQTAKDLASKFGEVKRPSKQDFCISNFVNWNNPEKVILEGMKIWDFSAKSTWTTLNAFMGSKDSNKTFKEFKEKFCLQTAQTKNGLKVYKINFEELEKKEVKVNIFTIDDFKAEALRQKQNLKDIPTTTTEEVVIDDKLEIVEVDF